ncbi:MAG: SpoIIE family protein phosphatase [Chloroflexaceae bacterium]|nr:SpoIIE family protein phosphatase [Chloroflexaceae bacterium]
MDQAQPAPRFGERYEIVAEGEQARVEVVDREPWRRCWACGTTTNGPGESFCANCGADLRDRRYHGILTSDASGLSLISMVRDETARSFLPPIWDQMEEGGLMLILFQPDDATPVSLPLDETVALRVGKDLATLLAALHQQKLELGPLVPADIGLLPTGQPRLLKVDNLHLMNDAEYADAVGSDLLALAGLLEVMTNTQRRTQRLDHATARATPLLAENEPDIAVVLREIRTGAIRSADELVARLESLYTEHTNPIALHQFIGSFTDTGRVRDHNEDSLLTMKLCMNNTSIDRTWGVYIVADGMGGHAGGEVASGLAIRRVAEVIMSEYLAFSLAPEAAYDERRAREIVYEAVLQANELVRQEGLSRGNDMGTTLTMALVVGDRAVVANVGDSRTYLYRDGKLHRISKDHSLVMRLVELGQISDNDIYIHPQRNAVLRSLGDRATIEVDIFTRRLRSGDALLLCSDGQWEMTRDPEMEGILASYDDPEQTCRELVEAANRAGGEDNISVVLVHFV